MRETAAPLRRAGGALLLGLLLVDSSGCVAERKAEAEIVPDLIPADFVEPEGGIVDIFHTRLTDDEGDWIERPPFGRVWKPRVADDWSPYKVNGHWADTDLGLTWLSAEPWGWATYHYGRWFYAPEKKWLWVPGTRWAPAWVAWRSGEGMVGWAPLPPVIGFATDHGLDPGTATISMSHFVFLPTKSLLSPDPSHLFLADEQIRTIFGRTLDDTRYRMVHHRIVNAAIGPHRLAEWVGGARERQTVASLVRGGANAAALYQPAALAAYAARSRREFGAAIRHEAPVRQAYQPASLPSSRGFVSAPRSPALGFHPAAPLSSPRRNTYVPAPATPATWRAAQPAPAPNAPWRWQPAAPVEERPRVASRPAPALPLRYGSASPAPTTPRVPAGPPRAAVPSSRLPPAYPPPQRQTAPPRPGSTARAPRSGGYRPH